MVDRDRHLCKCDNPSCGLALTLIPTGLGACPRCGEGKFRLVHPLAYETSTQKVFSESAVNEYATKGIEKLEELLAAYAEMDKYGET